MACTHVKHTLSSAFAVLQETYGIDITTPEADPNLQPSDIAYHFERHFEHLGGGSYADVYRVGDFAIRVGRIWADHVDGYDQYITQHVIPSQANELDTTHLPTVVEHIKFNLNEDYIISLTLMPVYNKTRDYLNIFLAGDDGKKADYDRYVNTLNYVKLIDLYSLGVSRRIERGQDVSHETLNDVMVKTAESDYISWQNFDLEEARGKYGKLFLEIEAIAHTLNDIMVSHDNELSCNLAIDLHQFNVMVDDNGNFILTDPYA